MLGAIEQLMRLHPASQFGRWERGRADFEILDEVERWHVPPEPEHEIERRESTRMLGEVAAAAAILVLFIGVLTVLARWSADAPAGVAQQPAVVVAD